MTQFIDELGTGYMNEMLAGAPFMYKEEVHLFHETVDKAKVAAWKLGPDAPRCNAEMVYVPTDIFDGWKAFAFPTLGYRCELDGQVLAYLTRNNSTRRGLQPRDMHVAYHDVSYQCMRTFDIGLNHYSTNNVKAYMAMKPKYTPFITGVEKILRGEIASFALSAEFAVAPHDGVPFLEILFRQRRVGTIDNKGNTTITGVNINSAWLSVINGVISNE